MERDIGDILDRGSIAKLKQQRINKEESNIEWDAFKPELDKATAMYPAIPIPKLYHLMKDINAMIWDLEADLRQKKLDGALYEVGLRAIAIREHNSLRVALKNIVNDLTKTGYQDVKQNHLSE